MSATIALLPGDGVGPEVVVGLCVERSLEMVVALLGILKAGGGVVPLDPGLPVGRLERMAADCGLTTVAADRRNLDRAQEIYESFFGSDITPLTGATDEEEEESAE